MKQFSVTTFDVYYYERLAAWYESKAYQTGDHWWIKLAAEFYIIAERMRVKG